jgi:uncharacterized UBP type Zn finger protein
MMEIVDSATAPMLCEHTVGPRVEPRSKTCEECGSTFNLRACVSCGHVGCCESQAGHARAHALGERHPVIQQVTANGPGWAWCYEENRYLR